MANWQELLEELVQTRRRALVGYAYMLAGDVAEAEDLVHDAVLRTFRTPRPLKDADHAEAYVKRAIATQFLNRRRSHGRFAARMHLFVGEASAPDPGEAHATTDAVRAALAVLSPRERACTVLRFYDQQSVAEIAVSLGLAEGSVKRYLSDAVKKLGARLDAHFELGSAPAAVVSAQGRRRP